MKYLRLFETEAEYTAATLDYPNVAYISATDRVAMEKDAPTPPTPPTTYKARLTLQDTSTVDIPLNGSSTLTSAETSGYSATCASVEITTAVTTIGERAFYDYRSLTSVTLPNTITSIGTYGFGYCNILPNITLPNSLITIGESAFENCTSLSSITIPSGVTSIGDWAFEACRSISSITIPDSVTSIGSNAFSEYSELEQAGLYELILGSGLQYLGGQHYIHDIKVKTTNFDGYPCSFGEYMDEFGNTQQPVVFDYYIDDLIEIDWCTDCDRGCECDPCDENGDCYDPCADPYSECYDPSQCEGGEEEPSEE